MCIIAGFLVIDQFSFRSSQHIYILTHWHSDHYQGITHSWNYGPIYASSITRRLLLTKYPQLIDRVTEIYLNNWINTELNGRKIRLYAIDSNHMAGSIMILIQYKNKYYFHTGDMRFSPKIAERNPQIFSKITDSQYKCQYQIEQLHLDNTFCDPIFQFPSRSQALKQVVQLVKDRNPSRLFICTDTAGKQEAFILLARYYQSKICINANRMEYVRQMFDNYSSFFTLNPEQTWIQVIPKSIKQRKIVESKGSIGVTLTGWTNLQESYPDGYNSFLVPYSLHSNFREMEMLVSWIRPKVIIPIVREGSNKWESFSKKISSLNAYIYNLSNVKQRGLDFLRQQYCLKQINE